MTQFTWTYDAPSGVFKSHEMSARLYEQVTEDSVWMDHVSDIDDAYGKGMGETVTWTRLSSITEPTTLDIVEGIRIPEDEYSFSTDSVTVGEIGRAIPYTSLAQDLSFFDLENKVQRALVDQLRRGLDTKVATKAKEVNLKYVPSGSAAGSFETGSASVSATAAANFNPYHAEAIYDAMYDTYLIPPYVGDDYMGVFRWQALRGMISSPEWEEFHKYTDPSGKFNNEVGRWANIRFQRTNHSNALSKTGTGDVLGEGVIFGQDFLAMAEAESPSLVAKTGGDDFGRSKAVAWYGILAFCLIWASTSNAGEVRGVHVGSAA